MEFGLFVEYPLLEGDTQAEIFNGCNVPLGHEIKAVRLINEKVAPKFK